MSTTPSRKGAVGKCVICGHKMAGRATAKKLEGVRQSAGHGRCANCASRERKAGSRRRRAGISDPIITRGWREQSVCVGADPLLFEADGVNLVPEYAQGAALRYCLTCPVRVLCEGEARLNADLGLRGGMWRTGTQVIDLLEGALT